jgi:hypothetical protein
MSQLSPEHRVLQLGDATIFEKVRRPERRYPQLNGRALRAGYLAAGGAVQLVIEGVGDTYHVTSSYGNGDPSCYIVQLDANGTLKQGTCTCPDYFNGVKGLDRGAPRIEGNPKCKHVLAVAIVRCRENEKASDEVEARTEAQGTTRGSVPWGDGSTDGETAQSSNPNWQGDRIWQGCDAAGCETNESEFVAGDGHRRRLGRWKRAGNERRP